MPNPVLIYTAMTTLPLQVVTLLWPTGQIREESPRVEIRTDRDGRAIGVRSPES